MIARWLLLLLPLWLLAGCASFKEVPSSAAPLQPQVQDQPFDVAGRLAVNLDGKGHVAGFDWQHTADDDQLAIKTPVGNTVASLHRDSHGVTLLADGQQQFASDVETLTERQLGWPLPLANLVWWVRGHPAPQFPYTTTPEGHLQQQGWLIRIHRDAANLGQPRRVELEREGLIIRLVLSDWRQFVPLQPDTALPAP